MGADDRHRRRAGGRRLRRPGAAPLAPPAQPHAPPVRRARRRVARRCAPAQQRPLVGRVRRPGAHRGRHHPPGHRGQAARPGPRTLGRAGPGRPQGGRGRAGRAGPHDDAERRGDPPPRARPGGVTVRSGVRGRDRLGHRAVREGAGGARCPDHPAGGLRRRAPQLPGRGAVLAGLPRRGRAGRLPGARHGPGQDAHGPRAHRPHHRPRARARHRPARRRRQLGGRGGPLHAPAAGGRPPRRLPSDGRRAGVGRGRRRRRHHDVRHRGPRRRGAGRAPVGPDRPRRGPGHQEPGQRDGPTAAPAPRPHPGRAHRHPDRERPRRPVGAPRLHQPGARRHPSRLHGPDGRRGRGRAAGPQRHPRVPADEERAGGGRRAPRPHRRARPLHA